MRRPARKLSLVTTVVFAAALLYIGVGPLAITASAAQLQQRSLAVANNEPGQTSRYVISMTIVDDSVDLGSVKAEFCENTALFEIACTAPDGFDITTASLASQTGTSGFTIDPASTANDLRLTRAPGPQPAGPISFVLDGVRNANDPGSQYARYSTFQSADTSGTATDQGSVAYVLNPDFFVNSEVPPYLALCLGVTVIGVDCTTAQGNYVNLGELSTVRPATGQTQVVIATNAANGYSLIVGGSTMISGNNSIPPLNTPTASAIGLSQFGINARLNSAPVAGSEPQGPGSGQPTSDYGQANRFVYRAGDVIASDGGVEDYRKYTITYLVNISRNQPPGVYSSTFTYTGIGNF